MKEDIYALPLRSKNIYIVLHYKSDDLDDLLIFYLFHRHC